jgi:hypothetical protein
MAESGRTNGGSLTWNFKLLGHNSLEGFGGMGEGMSMQFAKDGRRILWLAHESVAPAVFGTPDRTLCSNGSSLKLLLPKLGWREEAVPLDQPGGVVGLAEL